MTTATRPVVVVHVTHHPCGTVELVRWVDGRRAAGWRYGPDDRVLVAETVESFRMLEADVKEEWT